MKELTDEGERGKEEAPVVRTGLRRRLPARPASTPRGAAASVRPPRRGNGPGPPATRGGAGASPASPGRRHAFGDAALSPARTVY